MELQNVSQSEYDTISDYAQYVSDNMILILKDFVSSFENIKLIPEDLTLLTNNKNSEIEYQHNTFSLANTHNFEKIISKFKQYKNLQAYIPKSEDPICKTFHERNKKYNQINHIIFTSIVDIMLNNSNNKVKYIIIPVSLWCDYDITDFNDKQGWIFNQNHANILIINKSTLDCTILDPHGPMNQSKKTKSIIYEFNKNIPSKYHIKYVNNENFKINDTKCVITHQIQGSDYLCSTWVCYMLYEILNDNTTLLNHKYKSIANMIRFLIYVCDKFKTQINIYKQSKIYINNLRFVPKRYIKIYKSLYQTINL